MYANPLSLDEATSFRERAERALKSVRLILIEEIEQDRTAEILAQTVNRAAGAEAVLRVSHDIEALWTNQPEDAERAVRSYLTGLLLRGADDSWSGRGNDTKRAAHDELVKLCSDFRIHRG